MRLNFDILKLSCWRTKFLSKKNVLQSPSVVSFQIRFDYNQNVIGKKVPKEIAEQFSYLGTLLFRKKVWEYQN